MLKKANFLTFLTFLTLLSVKLYSQTEIPAYEFLRIDPSARASALGGAFDTYTDDPNVMFYNPASLSTATSKKISAGFGKYYLDMNFGTLAYMQKYKDIGWFGAGVKYFNYGKFDYTDENGEPTGGQFGATDLMFQVSYSNFVYEKINFGITAKYIYSSIAEYKSSAAAIDFGFLYMIPGPSIALSFSVNNLGTQLSRYIDTKERLPLDVRFGFSKKLEHTPLRVSVSFAKLNESTEKIIQRLKAFSIGGEFTFGQNLCMRIGYSNEKRQDFKLGTTLGLAGFSAGVGLNFSGKYALDYAFNSTGKVGSTHRFNVGYAF
jgi:hypothetical protein